MKVKGDWLGREGLVPFNKNKKRVGLVRITFTFSMRNLNLINIDRNDQESSISELVPGNLLT